MEQLFKDFGECVLNADHREAEKKIQLMINLLQEEINVEIKGLSLTVIFDRNSGISRYLRSFSKYEASRKPIIKALELMYIIVNNLTELLKPHVNEIIDSVLVAASFGNYSVYGRALSVIECCLTKLYEISEESLETIKEFLKEKLNDGCESSQGKTHCLFAVYIRKYPYRVTLAERQKYIPALVKHIALGYKQSESRIDLLNALLSLHSDLLEFDKKVLYDAIKKNCEFTSDPKKRKESQVVYRAALLFFAEHYDNFPSFVVEDAAKWEYILCERGDNWDNVKARLKALDSLYKLAGEYVRDVDILQSFITRLVPKLDKRMNSNERRVFIKGLNYISRNETFRTTNEQEINRIFMILLEKVNATYVAQEAVDDDLENLPDYLEALASLIEILYDLDDSYLSSLQDVAVLMVRLFPKLAKPYHYLAIESFKRVTTIVDRPILTQVIEKSILWTCSHASAYEVETLPLDNVDDIVTFKTYLPLWLGILNQQTVVNTFLSSYFVLVNRLNLDFELKDELQISLEIDNSYQPANKNDYVVLVNMTDLYVTILDCIQVEYYEVWVKSYTHHLMTLICNHLLISAFYKVMAANLRLMDKLNINADDTLKDFIDKVLMQMNATDDDLLISCIDLILSTPTKTIEKLHNQRLLSKVFSIAFSFGRTIPKITIKSIQTLIRWYSDIDITPYVETALPQLNPYLKSTATQTPMTEFKAATKCYKRHKIHLSEAPEMKQLQEEILSLLALLDYDLLCNFVEANDGKLPMTELHCDEGLQLQLKEDDVSLGMDGLLGRVAELAESCADMSTRFHACELLHSIVLMIVGNVSKDISEGNFKKIIQVVVLLGTDNCSAIKQLFGKLAIQMMHWYSSDMNRNYSQKRIVTNVLLEQIGTASNSKLKVFSAQCLNEFISHIIKQSNSKTLQNRLIVTDEIIEHIQYLARQPESMKRFGGTIAFLTMQDTLLQEELFVGQYWMKLFYTFLGTLTSCDEYEEGVCLEKLCLAVEALVDGVLSATNLVPHLDEVCELLLKSIRGGGERCRELCARMYVKVADGRSGKDEEEDTLNRNEGLWKKTVTVDELHSAIDLFSLLISRQLVKVANVSSSIFDCIDLVTVDDALLKHKKSLAVSLINFLLLTEKEVKYADFLMRYIFSFNSNADVSIKIIAKITNRRLQEYLSNRKQFTQTMYKTLILIQKYRKDIDLSEYTRNVVSHILSSTDYYSQEHNEVRLQFALDNLQELHFLLTQFDDVNKPFHKYETVIIPFIVREDVILEHFLHKTRYLIKIFNFIKLNPGAVHEDDKKGIVKIITNHWIDIAPKNAMNILQFIQLLELMHSVCPVKNSIVANWILSMIMWKQCGISEQEQTHVYIKLVNVLGMITNKVNERHLQYDYITTPARTTLLIEAAFGASLYEKTVGLLVYALILHSTKTNTFTKDIKGILKLFVFDLDNDLQLKLAHKLLNVTKENSHNVKLAEALADYMEVCDYKVFEEFYASAIEESIIAPFNDQDYNKKILACILVKTLCYRTDTVNMDCPIFKAAITEPKSDRDLLKKLSATLAFTCDKEPPTDPDALELYRSLNCHAYNALATLICNATSDPPSYRLLFKRDNNILWSRMVDLSKVYNFQMKSDSAYKTRKQLVKIKDQEESPEGEKMRKGYLESQNLFLSTLSEDICKYDLNNALVRSQKLDPLVAFNTLTVQLSDEPLDKQESMSYVCATIKHMHKELLITQKNLIDPIKEALMDDDTPSNVKLFLVKAIEHSAEFLKDFAEHLIGAVIKVLVDGFAGEGINCFTSDVMVMLLTVWKDVGCTDGALLSRLMELLVDGVGVEDAEIRRHNLKILELSVEQWAGGGHLCNVPSARILRYIKEDKKLAVRICNIFLINDVPPWGEKMKDFWVYFTDLLREQQVMSVALPCAEVIGLALKYIFNDEKLRARIGKIIGIIDEVVCKQSKNQIVLILERITLNYPQICENYREHLDTGFVHLLPAEAKRAILRICLRFNIDKLHSMDFKALLEDADHQIQMLTLEIIEKNQDRFSNVQALAGLIANRLSSMSVPTRAAAYNALMACNVKTALLTGFNEKDPEIQQTLNKFWTSNPDYPREFPEKLKYTINEMYTPVIEDQYLQNCTNLLLDKLQTDLKTKLFNKPLADCEFKPLNLSSHWKTQHSSLVPLFAASIPTSEIEFRLSKATQSVPEDVNPLRTQRLEVLSGTSLNKYKAQEVFKNPNDYKIFKKRFTREKGETNKSFAMYTIKKKEVEVKKQKDQVQRKNTQFVANRVYRDGDFPDIEICYEDVLAPLRMLVKYDLQMAQLTFTALFNCVSEKHPNIVQSITRGLVKIFESSMSYNPLVMTALLDIAILNKDQVKLNPQLISTVCRNSGLMSTGVILLEEYLMMGVKKDGEEENDEGAGTVSGNKRLRSMVTIDSNELHWIKLAELYKEMDDWDPVRAIFLNKLKTPSHATGAINNESQHCMKRALDLYLKSVNSDKNEDHHDFYYESIIKCCSELISWKELSDIVGQIAPIGSGFDQLFSNDFNRERLLPAYLRANVYEKLGAPDELERFVETINKLLCEAEKSAYLKDTQSGLLAFMSFCVGDAQRSNHFVQVDKKNFYERWAFLNGLITRPQISLLIDVLDSIRLQLLNDPKRLYQRQLIKSWDPVPCVNNPPIVAQVKAMIYKEQFVKVFDELRAKVALFNSGMDLAENAMKNRSYFLARKYTKFDYGYATTRKLYVGAKFEYYRGSWKEGSEKQSVAKLQSMQKFNLVFGDPLGTQSDYLQAAKKMFRIATELDLDPMPPIEINGNNFTDLETLRKYTREKLEEHIQLAQEAKMELDSIAICYYELAKAVQGNEMDSFIVNTLRGMKYGSADAGILFPYVFSSEDDLNVELVLIESENVPIWMFLRWIPQLYTYFMKHRDIVKRLLMRIAKEYPNALVYTYKVGTDDDLDKFLKNNLVGTLKDSLSAVCSPYVALKTILRNLSKAINAKEKFMDVHRSALVELYGNKTVNYRAKASTRGIAYSFLEKHKSAIEKLGMGTFSKVRIEAEITKLSNKLEGERGEEAIYEEKERRKNDIGFYSQWLKNYSSSGVHQDELEIPGQYKHNQKPQVKYHVKIHGFSSCVKIFTSLRKPIRIGIFGSDGVEYKFLVKCGEDLRQDQRLEQMFTLMNNTLRNDIDCNARKLNNFTYEVIPMNTNLGIIEWVEETNKLETLIDSHIKNKNSVAEANATHNRWIANAKSPAGAALRYSKTDAAALYRSIVDKLPTDALRSSFKASCVNTQHFFVFRDTFVRSYATMCATNYLLGIGDRHLSNILVSCRDGRAVGIDFGHAFGTATVDLSVPELVPFRLTPQIETMMSPHGPNGPFRFAMVCVLKALGRDPKTLMSALDVFVKEPTFGWSTGGHVKVEIARKKFQVANSYEVMSEEVRGRGNDDVRVKFKYLEFLKHSKDVKTVEEQVDVLIEHAMDSNLLARMFIGWQAWL